MLSIWANKSYIHLCQNNYHQALIMAENILKSDLMITPGTQCSKIRKKCNFKSTKTQFLPFQKWQKINFCTRKKLQFSGFFLMQKLIFCYF